MRIPRTTLEWVREAVHLAGLADYANKQSMPIAGLCTPTNPYGQSTAKLEDGTYVDRHVMRRLAEVTMIRKLVILGMMFQAGHFVEHLTQVYMWVAHDRTTAYMSPLAMWLACHLGGHAVGMEVLHLIWNLVFLATLYGMLQLGTSPALRHALMVEGFHLVEHVMLTSTVILGGTAAGLSTLFGDAELLGGRTFAVGYRVWWHFGMNAIPSVLMVRHMLRKGE